MSKVYVIEIKNNEVLRVISERNEDAVFIVRNRNLPRYDNGMPVIEAARVDVDHWGVAANFNRYMTEDKSDLAVHGQENLSQ